MPECCLIWQHWPKCTFGDGALNRSYPSFHHRKPLLEFAAFQIFSFKDEDGLVDAEGSTPYAKLSWSLLNDPKWQREMALGKRIGLYRFRGDVGSGNFSKVKLAFHQLTHERVAVKIVDKVGLDAKGLVMLSREIDSMTKLNHPHIVRLYEVVETLNRVHLIMEYAPGGELYNQIIKEGPMNESDAKSAFLQIVSAVEHMHEHGLVHRDIKAENVFIHSKGHLKLGDFGFTTFVKGDEVLDTFCGSPPYAAPELFTDDSYTGTAVDIWALGVLLYFIVCGRMPFDATTVVGLKNQILEGKVSYTPTVTTECRELIGGIMQAKVSDRFNLKDIKEHQWLQGQEMPASLKSSSREDLDTLLSEIEKRSLKELSDLGISEELIEEEIKKGCRSPVVGAYRIIVQRNLSSLTNGKSKPTEEQCPRSQTPSPNLKQQQPSIKIIPSSPQKQTRRKLKQKISQLAVSKHNNNKSKSCCIM